ncbi:DUF2357 domain-containing protein [Niallia sp. RD1]|uniref:DUF2357 domain-containing protein n=1 Tax=Niallia sp. RD1 TaxID=2962858 RepID=UPI0020C1A0C3|nr:DUF2357 domain-containing protein [Niallia sp. RD1]UTI43283.1 DUF2357 domain-containing protein [Niallia sp. RD1]
MLSLNQFIIKWPNSKKSLKVQRNSGGIGPSAQLVNENVHYNVTAFLEAKMLEEITPMISYNEDSSNLFHPFALREEGTYIITAIVPKQSLTQDSGPFIDNYTNHYIEFFPMDYWRETDIHGELFVEIIGELSTKNFVGTLDLSLGTAEVFLCEIAARKIDYERDYTYFLNEIAEESSNLLMQFGGLTRIHISNNELHSDKFSQIFQLRSIMKELPEAIDTVLLKFHNKLYSNEIHEPIGLGKLPDTQLMAQKIFHLDLKPKGILDKKFNGYTPERIVTTEKNETNDTPENRYIKAFLEELHFIIQKLHKTLEQNTNMGNPKKIFLLYELEVRKWLDIIENYLSLYEFRGIGRMNFFPSNSQVLQNRAGYQDVLLLDLRLQSGMQLNWNPLMAVTNDIYVKPVYELYEVWCFFILRNILRELLGSEIKTINLFTNDSKVNFNLRKGSASGLVFQKGKTMLTLYYNKEFSRHTKGEKSYSLSFRPDFTFQFSNEGKDYPNYLIHFDAKYKIDNLNDLESEIKSSKKEDIIKMHAYKDGILNTLGAYVLYPGNEFRNFQVGNDIIPGIGAVPLAPNNTDARSKLKSFISDIINHMQS